MAVLTATDTRAVTACGTGDMDTAGAWAWACLLWVAWEEVSCSAVLWVSLTAKYLQWADDAGGGFGGGFGGDFGGGDCGGGGDGGGGGM